LVVVDLVHHDVAEVLGHRQVTETYLAQFARARGGRLTTFDRGVAGLHADVAYLVPTMAR
jgi:hypothetical protein